MWTRLWYLNFSGFHIKFLVLTPWADRAKPICVGLSIALFSFLLAYLCCISDVVYSWQDIPIQSHDLEEPELMQQPSPNSGSHINIMENI